MEPLWEGLPPYPAPTNQPNSSLWPWETSLNFASIQLFNHIFVCLGESWTDVLYLLLFHWLPRNVCPLDLLFPLLIHAIERILSSLSKQSHSGKEDVGVGPAMGVPGPRCSGTEWHVGFTSKPHHIQPLWAFLRLSFSCICDIDDNTSLRQCCKNSPVSWKVADSIFNKYSFSSFLFSPHLYH